MRVAFYARYSTDNQSVASIEDQFRICREHAGRERWQIIDTYHDAAISGASVILRPGIQALLQDAQRGKFDIVLAEALDRVSRDQADVATLFKHLRFAGIQIVTLAEGEISELHVGLKGTMNALFLKDLAAKTHRGLRGRVEKGKAGGGLCYGYDVVKRIDSEGEPVRGERAINEAEAVVVRRIYREFAAGKSPRAIATDLNRDGIPGPFGHSWGDTTIRGHASRGNGIVNNELYIGMLVWNRQRFIKDPSTGKRVSRPNSEAKWIRTEVPALRIVDDELWQRVKRRQAELAKQFEATTKGVRAARAERLNGLRRPAFLLSGLLICGCCGGRYGIVVNDRYGCLGHFRKGICDNGRTVRRDDIERRVLAGLTDKLVSPEAVAAAVRAHAEETNRQNHERRAQAEADRRSLDKIERGIKGIMAAIEDGMYQPTMKARMGELAEQKAEIEARLADAPADMPDVHPNIAELYRTKVIRLAETLADPESNGEAREDIRSLVGEVVLTPGEKRGQINAILRGELMAVLDLAAGRRRSPRPEVITTALAGPRNQIKPLKLNTFQRVFVGRSEPRKSPKLPHSYHRNSDLRVSLRRAPSSLVDVGGRYSAHHWRWEGGLCPQSNRWTQTCPAVGGIVRGLRL
ncbi:MAG: recombinase family protein [Aliidongia sp.]